MCSTQLYVTARRAQQRGDVVALPLRDSDASELRGRDSNPDYLIQSQASYH